MDQIKFEIHWKDLSLTTQADLADLLEIDTDQVEKAMNWDVFPVTTVYFDRDEIDK